MRSLGRAVRVAQRREVVPTAGGAPASRKVLPPRRAYSLAAILVDDDGRAGWFVDNAGRPFAAEAVATCSAGAQHAVPAPTCRCGFAATDLDDLLVVAGPAVLQPSRASAVLEVELGGREVERPRGYRAAQQRVLAAAFVPVCHWCAAEEGRLVPSVALGGFPSGPRARRWPIAPLCESHGRALGAARVWSLATVTGLVGAEVAWAGPAIIEELFPHAPRLPRPPEPSALPVAELSRGQVGHVEVTAVQVGADGSVWIDGAALAPSRRPTPGRVPVRRMADLRFEIWSRTLGVHGRIPSPSPLTSPPGPGLMPVAAVHSGCRCPPEVPCDLGQA